MTTAPLDGRHALVTGAGRGIGRAIALQLAERGAALTLVARSLEALTEVAEAVTTAGAASVAVEPVDLLDRDERAELCETVAASADVLVNNAGMAPSAPLERTGDDAWDDVLELNVTAPFALCRAALPAMAERGYGRVINLASTAALEGYAYTAAYVASKHALLGLTRALRAEAAARWQDADLAVSAVCPGFVDTDIVAASVAKLVAATGLDAPAARERLARMNPSGRLLTPDEVAAAVVAQVLAPREEVAEHVVLGG